MFGTSNYYVAGHDVPKEKIIRLMNFRSAEDAEPFYNLPMKILMHIHIVTQNDEKNGFCKNRLYYLSSRINASFMFYDYDILFLVQVTAYQVFFCCNVALDITKHCINLKCYHLYNLLVWGRKFNKLKVKFSLLKQEIHCILVRKTIKKEHNYKLLCYMFLLNCFQWLVA